MTPTDHGQLTKDYPCFCLCFVFVQMTRTIPLRRTILQFSQMRRTLLRTFMTQPLANNENDGSPTVESVFIATRAKTLKLTEQNFNPYRVQFPSFPLVRMS